jgi:hypothetical protein
MANAQRYADGTLVPVERSRVEVEKTLKRFGISEYFYGSGERGAGIGFVYRGRKIQMNVPNPDPKRFTTPAALEKELRRIWRVLLLWLKANIEMVDSGLVKFEDIFLAQTCLPSGQTVSMLMQDQLNKLIASGEAPKGFLPGVSGGA